MFDVVVVGAGNVATLLHHIFVNANLSCAMAVRGELSGGDLCSIDDLPGAPLYVIAVKDSAIEQVAEKVAAQVSPDAIICHTAGSVSIDALPLSIENAGVFYPLQSFSLGRDLRSDNFTIFVEARSAKTLSFLMRLATAIGHRCVELDSQRREKMHLAAIFASNFTNYMYSVTEDILKDCDVDFSHMKPLIAECASKVCDSDKSPIELQTGPAMRGDRAVIEHHIEMLDEPQLKEIYTILSRAIERRRDEEF